MLSTGRYFFLEPFQPEKPLWDICAEHPCPKTARTGTSCPPCNGPRDEGWGVRGSSKVYSSTIYRRAPRSVHTERSSREPAGKEKRWQRVGHTEHSHTRCSEGPAGATGTKVSAPGRPQLQSWGQLGHHNIKKDSKLLESVQRRAMRMEKGLERVCSAGSGCPGEGRRKRGCNGWCGSTQPSSRHWQIWFFRLWCCAFPCGKHRIHFSPKQYL